MTEEKQDADDSLDFTVILMNPSQATTQSWSVAEAIGSLPKAPRESALPAAAAPKLNDQFEIGVAPGNAPGMQIRRLRKRASSVVPQGNDTVLVCDDDLVTRKVLEKLLMNDGYSVKSASGRDEFMQALKTGPFPGLILLDVNLPDMSGFDMLAGLRRHARGATVPVVMVTSCARQEDLERALALGADGYLSKPVTVALVRKVMRAIMGER